MHRSLIAVVLCIFTGAAGAQCLANAPTAANQRQGVDVIKASAMTVPAQPVARPGGELITAAAAGTHDVQRVAQGTTVMRASPAKLQDGEEAPRRGGTAMLLAALALMSGIALRRYASNGQ